MMLTTLCSVLIATTHAPTLWVSPVNVRGLSVDGSALGRRIESVVSRSSRFTLVDASLLGGVEEGLKTCVQGNCFAELGYNLGARFLILSDLSSLGGKLDLSMRLLEVAGEGDRIDATIVRSLSIDAADERTLLRRLEERIPELLGGPKASTTLGFDESEDHRPVLKSGGIRAAQSGVFLGGRPSDAQVQIKGPDDVVHRGRIGDKISPLAAGAYRWRAEAAGYEDGRGTFELKVDEIGQAEIRLRRLAQLTVRGEPGRAKVVVKGPGFERSVGIGSTLSDLPLGAYSIRVSKRGFETEEHAVELGDGAQETLVVLLETPGSLEITGTPQGATVELIGPKGFKAKDGLPLSLSGALRGTYELRVYREGYRSFRGKVTVEPAKTTRLEVTLKRGRDGPYGEVPLEVLKEFRALRLSWLRNPSRQMIEKYEGLKSKYPALAKAPWPTGKHFRRYKVAGGPAMGGMVNMGLGAVLGIGLTISITLENRGKPLEDQRSPFIGVAAGGTLFGLGLLLHTISRLAQGSIEAEFEGNP